MENTSVVPTVLSTLAGFGVIGTAVLAARGHKKACDILANCEIPEDLNRKDALIEAGKLTWKEYAPAVAVGGLTIGLIFTSNGMHLKKEAALVGIVGVLGARLKNMDRAVLEQYGKDALDKIRNVAAKQEMEKHTDALSKVASKGGPEEEIYYEPFTEQFFSATPDEIKTAELGLNEQMKEFRSTNLGSFIELLPKRCKLDIPDWAYDIGWYQGDETFEWNAAAANSRYISLNPTPTEVNGWQASVIQFSIYPSEPGEDYIDILKGAKVPYSMYRPEPGDQLDLRNVDLSLPFETEDEIKEPEVVEVE